MFVTISLVIFWLLFIVGLIGSIRSKQRDSVDAVIILVIFILPALIFMTLSGWVMPIICIWITLIAVGAMITS